jgi:hypothetical protein
VIATLKRLESCADRTLGVLLFDGIHFCHTLEDIVRPTGIKVNGETAIPAGIYRLSLENSPKFGKNCPSILGVPGFSGVRVHGGNGPKDTNGCPLVAFNRVGNSIQGQAKDALAERLTLNGGSCLLIIVDYFKHLP